MPVASFNKFDSFVEACAQKKHNLATDQLTVALCAAANPPVAGNDVLADLTQISYTNCSSRNVTTTSCVQTAGILKLVVADLILSASGGAVAAFRYVCFYNNTATNDELIGWYDAGSDVTIPDGETYTLDADATTGILTIA